MDGKQLRAEHLMKYDIENMFMYNSCNIYKNGGAYYYDDGNTLINDICYKIKRNELIIITGFRGVGKEWLAKILTKYDSFLIVIVVQDYKHLPRGIKNHVRIINISNGGLK